VKASRRYLVPQICIAMLLMTSGLVLFVSHSDVVSVLLSESTSAPLPMIALAGLVLVLRLLCVLIAGPALLVWALLDIYDRYRCRTDR
jgi:hypothetical protein